MARRRKNPLLGRILIISVVVHVIAIPILAYFGAFKKIEQSFHRQEVTIVPLPPEKDKPVAPRAEPKKAAAPEKKAPGQQASKSVKSDPNQPKVAASTAPPGAGDAGGPTVNPQGNGKAGEVPKPAGQGPGNGTGTGTGPGTGTGTEPPKEKAKASPERNNGEAKPDPTSKPKVPEKKTPVMVSAEPLDQPSPEIPDDLRAEALDKSTVVMISVSPSGSASDVSVVSSSGVSELDDLALRAARRWKFRPATRDGEPVAGHVRLHVRFKVD